MLRLYVIDHCMEFDYDKLNHFMPVLNPLRMKNTIQYIKEVLCTGNETKNIYTPTTGELALVLAAETNDQLRRANNALARQFYEKCRKVLLLVFDEVESNLDIAAAFMYMGTYLTAQGEIQRALYFITNARECLQNLIVHHSDKQIYAYFVECMIQTVEVQLDENSDLFAPLRILNTLKYGFARYIQYDDITLIHDETLRNPDSNFCELVDKWCHNYFKIMDACTGKLPAGDIHAKRITVEFAAEGAKLQYQKTRNILDYATLNTANKVTSMMRYDRKGVNVFLPGVVLMEACIVQVTHLALKFDENLLALLREGFNHLTVISQEHYMIAKRAFILLPQLALFINYCTKFVNVTIHLINNLA